jgi:hypothetical protein
MALTTAAVQGDYMQALSYIDNTEHSKSCLAAVALEHTHHVVTPPTVANCRALRITGGARPYMNLRR